MPEGPVHLPRRSLLLRHGHVYSGGPAWTLAHDAWLRWTRLDQPGTRAAFEADYENVQLTLAAGTGSTRRSPRWPPTASSRP